MSGPAPKTIGSYEVERELAQGGMGVVFLARQPALDRKVVLKTLRRELADDATLADRFHREARAAAGLHHQNIVAVHDCFTWRGAHYIAQEYVDGVDLASALVALKRFAPRIAALIALELTRGLEEIHSRGVVHRDLKPSNILLGRKGEAKIADFGIALEATGPAVTRTGHAVGTPPYMSPEQLLGERVDFRSDVFSVGLILYEMLTGRAPFADGDPEREEGLVRRIQSGRCPPLRSLAPETPRALARLIRSCLRARPRKRPSSATLLRAALERQLRAPPSAICRAEIAVWLWERRLFRAEEGGTEIVARAIPRPSPTRRSIRWLAAAAALGGGLLAGSLALDLISVEGLDLPRLPPLLLEPAEPPQ